MKKEEKKKYNKTEKIQIKEQNDKQQKMKEKSSENWGKENNLN